MDAATVFSLANLFALAGWVVLAAVVVLRSPLLRDRVAGLAWPFVLSDKVEGFTAYPDGMIRLRGVSLAN